MKVNILIIFAIVIFEVECAKRTFDGFKVFKIKPKTENEVNFVKNIQKKGFGELWYDQVPLNYETRITVAPEKISKFEEEVQKTNIEANKIIADLQRIIDEQLSQDRSGNSNNVPFLSMTWDRYYDLDEINNWLDEIAKNYPSIVKTVVIGKSFENRDIKGIVINYNPEREEKLIGVLEGAMHAREWISPAVINWIVKEFLTSNDRVVRSIAENIEWHVFPVTNPDGYSYTFTTNRMWRKNRNTRNFTSCSASGVDDDMSNGVDLNRNFDFAWNTVGVSSDPCSNTFPGPSPASEPETQALANYILNIKDEGRFIYYYAIHSYSQVFIVPYSNATSTDNSVDNYADMYEIAARGVAKAQERYGTTYLSGIAADVLYPMSGNSFDWVKQETNVAVSYLLELRDLGEFGFLLPTSQIIPTSLEIMDAVVEMDKVTRQLGYYSGAMSLASSISLVCICIINLL